MPTEPASRPAPALVLAGAMPPAFSLYLDLVRVVAAVVVVIHHTWGLLVPRHPLPWPGHQAVVVFFVLSGLVIAHSVNRPGGSLRAYGWQRFRRIGSVAYPALALSFLVGALMPPGFNLPDAVPPTSFAEVLWRLVLNATFLMQSVWSPQPPPANAPFWSLDYEVWYYAVFGLWTYLAGRRRVAATLLAVLLAGPRIMLLMPVWLMGVWVYRRAPRLEHGPALALFLASGAAALGWVLGDGGIGIRLWMKARWPELIAVLHGSNQFIGDSLLGVMVALHFVAAANLAAWLAPLQRWSAPIRYLSSISFSIYLFHMPLFMLMFGILGWHSPLVWVALAIGIALLAEATERRLLKGKARTRQAPAPTNPPRPLPR